MDLSPQEIERAKFAFSIYDMDGSNTVDACRLGDLLRALELTPTLKTISKLGGTTRRGEKMLKIEEFLPIYADAKKDKDVGQLDDYIEVLKLYDKEGNGYISANQLSHLLLGYGEKLDHDEVLEIMNDCCEPPDDEGFTKWMPFLKRICSGPPEPQSIYSKSGNQASGPKKSIQPIVTVVDEDEMSRVPSVSYSEAKPMNPVPLSADADEEEEPPVASFTLKKPGRSSSVKPDE
ncbi:Myosin light chain alkali [Orchesella cincta]|uniref:Myosin light chain alkali n=1 Tax=Orchesella cincta TaxID=48709 RepID=A0A1D2MVS8_ORCCI|nr:Myosin light chain alkali [Orchesella cincta]